MYQKKSLLLLFCFLCTGNQVFAQYSPENKWQLLKEKPPIQVYARKNNDGMMDVKGTMAIKGNLHNCLTLLKNSQKIPEWVDKTVVFETFKMVSDSVWFTYMEMAIPWPFANKDLISENTLKKLSPNHFQIVAISKPDMQPEKEGKSRIKHSTAIWDVQVNSAKQLEISYHISTEADPVLPDWMIQKGMAQSMFNTLSNMQKELEK